MSAGEQLPLPTTPARGQSPGGAAHVRRRGTRIRQRHPEFAQATAELTDFFLDRTCCIRAISPIWTGGGQVAVRCDRLIIALCLVLHTHDAHRRQSSVPSQSRARQRTAVPAAVPSLRAGPHDDATSPHILLTVTTLLSLFGVALLARVVKRRYSAKQLSTGVLADDRRFFPSLRGFRRTISCRTKRPTRRSFLSQDESSSDGA